MQQVVAQMVIDDLEENPDCANEYFDCDCCGIKSVFVIMVRINDAIVV